MKNGGGLCLCLGRESPSALNRYALQRVWDIWGVLCDRASHGPALRADKTKNRAAQLGGFFIHNIILWSG